MEESIHAGQMRKTYLTGDQTRQPLSSKQAEGDKRQTSSTETEKMAARICNNKRVTAHRGPPPNLRGVLTHLGSHVCTSVTSVFKYL